MPKQSNPKISGNLRLKDWLKQLRKYREGIRGIEMPINTKHEQELATNFKNLIDWIDKTEYEK